MAAFSSLSLARVAFVDVDVSGAGSPLCERNLVEFCLSQRRSRAPLTAVVYGGYLADDYHVDVDACE